MLASRIDLGAVVAAPRDGPVVLSHACVQSLEECPEHVYEVSEEVVRRSLQGDLVSCFHLRLSEPKDD